MRIIMVHSAKNSNSKMSEPERNFRRYESENIRGLFKRKQFIPFHGATQSMKWVTVTLMNSCLHISAVLKLFGRFYCLPSYHFIWVYISQYLSHSSVSMEGNSCSQLALGECIVQGGVHWKLLHIYRFAIEIIKVSNFYQILHK